MGFKRVVLLGLGQVLLFACGVGATVSIQAGLYACALALALTALWLGASAAWAGRPSPPMRAAPPMPDMEAVRADQRLLRSLIDQTPAPLLMLHPDGVITAGNRAARTLFRTDDRLVAPPTALTEALKAGASGGRLTVELVAETSRRTYAMSLADLAGPHGTIRLAALLDIQPEIHAAEAAALRDLMQVLSHEIMNALTPVASLAATATELLADETPASLALARDAVATLARRAEGLMRFVDAYRTLARLPPPDPKPTSLAGLMEETARLFRSRWEPRGVRLELTCPSPDVVLELDADLAIHALSNILSNGAEAALETPIRTPIVRFAAQTDQAGATLTISDSGPGVSREHRERIFQSFFTTKLEGAGVGLSFARQVALSHGGELTLSAQAPGEGAVFLMRL